MRDGAGGRFYDDGSDSDVTEPLTHEKRAPSKTIVVGWTWPLRVVVALVILLEFVVILLVVSSLYPKGG
jgi:hypothetical protein